MPGEGRAGTVGAVWGHSGSSCKLKAARQMSLLAPAAAKLRSIQQHSSRAAAGVLQPQLAAQPAHHKLQLRGRDAVLAQARHICVGWEHGCSLRSLSSRPGASHMLAPH